MRRFIGRRRSRGVRYIATFAGAGAAVAAKPAFGPGTGIQEITYNGFSSYMSRSGSGIVQQWDCA